MATIQYGDLLKTVRGSTDQRYTILATRIEKGGSFIIGSQGNGTPLQATGKFILQEEEVEKYDVNKKDKNISNTISTWLNNRKSSQYMKIELGLLEDKIFKNKKYYRLTELFKDKNFGGVAGKSSGSGSERQENGLINFISDNVKEGPCKFSRNCANNTKLLEYQITGAVKKDGKNKFGDEPYIDVIIKTDKGDIGISCKGPTAPSLAGGGLSGLKRIVPELIEEFYEKAQNYIQSIKIVTRNKNNKIINSKALKDGDIIDANLIPDMSYEIPENYVEDILKGNEDMGGPIDYMYQGPMNVTGNVVRKNDGKIYLEPNGKFYSIDNYKKKVGKFYLVIRKRDLDQDNRIKLDFTEKNREGFVKLLKSPVAGKTNSRIIIQDKPRGEVI